MLLIRCATLNKRLGESGQSAAIFIVVFLVLMGMVGLVLDGGAMFLRYRRAQIAVDSAALVAATRLNRAEFSDSNKVQLQVGGTNGAIQAAFDFARANAPGLVTLTRVDVKDNQVDVDGVVTVEPMLLRLLGAHSLTLTLHASAELKHGITKEGQ
jgi:uncharacterized membrane protein